MHGGVAQALGWWQAWRPALAALASAGLVGLAARLVRIDRLAAAAGGLGSVAGFYLLAGFTWPLPGIMQRLAPVAALATFAALAATAMRPRAAGRPGRAAGLGPAATIAALALGGWFLAGAPLHLAPKLRWLEAAAVAAALAAGGLLITGLEVGFGARFGAGLGAGRVVLASVSLACGLSAAHAAHGWVLAALVPGAAMLGALPAAGRLVQPVAVAVAAVAAAWVLAAGDLHHGLRPVEAPVLAPMLAPMLAPVLAPVFAVWLAGRLAPRLRLAASGVSLAAATALVWMIAGGR